MIEYGLTILNLDADQYTRLCKYLAKMKYEPSRYDKYIWVKKVKKA